MSERLGRGIRALIPTSPEEQALQQTTASQEPPVPAQVITRPPKTESFVVDEIYAMPPGRQRSPEELAVVTQQIRESLVRDAVLAGLRQPASST